MEREQFEQMLADYLGGELGPEERRQFEAHLAECEADRAEAESLREVLTRLEQLASPVVVPEHAGPSMPRRRPLGRIFASLAYAAVLLIGVGIGWVAASPGTAPQTNHESTTPPVIAGPKSGLPEFTPPSPFIKNVIAFSTAMSQPWATPPSEQRAPKDRP